MWLSWALTSIFSLIAGVGGAAFLGRFPLTSCFDYDANFVCAIASSFLSAIVAASTLNLHKNRSPASSAIVGASAGISLGVGMLAAYYVLGLKCGFGDGRIFFAAFPVLSSVVSAAFGSLCGVLFDRFTGAILACFGIALWILARAFVTLMGPGAFAFNPFFGYFPGPLYDEAINLPKNFWLYRIFNMFYAAGFLGIAQRVWHGKFVSVEEKRHVLSNWSIVLAALAGIANIAIGGLLGFCPSLAQIKRELNASLPFAHGNIYYKPSNRFIHLADLLKDDLEYRAYKVSQLLNETPPNFDCYLYISQSQKKRLIGAGKTLYVDISGANVHLNPFSYPHPLLQHEVAHIMTKRFGLKPFGFSLSPGLVEGVAVALEGYRDEFSVHEWAKALVELKLSKTPSSLMAIGFWRESPQRSYIVVGSFVAYLKDKYGVSKLKFAYPFGDFRSIYHNVLKVLESDWNEFLADNVKSPKYLLERAKVRFEKPSIFERKCARELARIKEEARRLASSSPYKAALLLQNAYEISGGDDYLLVESADYLMLADNLQQAKDLLVKTLEQGNLLVEQRASGKILLGDVCALLGEYSQANSAYREIADSPVDPDVKASAQLKIGLSSSAPSLVSAVRALRFDELTEIPSLVDESKSSSGAAPYAAYLVGQWYFEQGEVEKASKALSKAANGIPVRNFELWWKAQRLYGLCQYLQKNFSQAENAFRKLKLHARYSGEQMEANDLLERVEWKQSQK